jgi:hypothetical protein
LHAGNDRRDTDANFQQWSVRASMEAFAAATSAMPLHSPFNHAGAAMAVGSPANEWQHGTVFVCNVLRRVDRIELVRIFIAVGLVHMITYTWFLVARVADAAPL